MRSDTKARLAEIAGYSAFLRLLVFNVWFRLAVISFLVFVILLVLCVPKMWTVTPEGVYPARQVSLIDKLQAWRLRRAAERLASQSQFDQSLQVWLSAAEKNPGDPELPRGYLRTIKQIPHKAKSLETTLAQADWLLRLSRTNLADVELVASVYEHMQVHGATTALVSKLGDSLPAPVELAYLKALFNENDLDRFRQRWQTARDRLPPAPEVDLFKAAHALGWGTGQSATDARNTLLAAGKSGERQVVASRLLLRVSRRLRDVTTAQTALNRLVDLRQDNMSDHSTFWRLLIDMGRSAEAAQLVQAYVKEPGTALEAIELADTYARVGLPRRAVDVLEGAIKTFGFSTQVCARYASVLMDEKDWAGLRALALKLRSHPGLPNSLRAFSYYMEGQSELGEGRRDSAEAAFDRIATVDTEDPDLGLALVNGLLDAGLLTQALAAITRLEEQLQHRRDYWNAVSRAAFVQTNMVMVLRAAQKAYEIEPSDPITRNNYATALLVERANPADALRLTEGLAEQLPGNAMARVNHAAALAQNGRAKEAIDFLARSEIARFTPQELSQYFLVRFEASLQLNLSAEARTNRDRIDRSHLYPLQRRWLEQNEKKLPAPSATTPGAG